MSGQTRRQDGQQESVWPEAGSQKTLRHASACRRMELHESWQRGSEEAARVEDGDVRIEGGDDVRAEGVEALKSYSQTLFVYFVTGVDHPIESPIQDVAEPAL